MRVPSRTACAVLLISAAFSLSSASANAASLVLDQNFRSPPLSRVLPAARALPLPDGKLLLYNGPDTLIGERRGAITRYHANGAFDPAFEFTRDYENVVAAVALANGQLIVSALQRAYDDVNVTERVLRLNSDGSIDSSFNAQLVAVVRFGSVRTISVQPDGKILVCGIFDTFGATSRSRMVRLLADGTLDTTFNPPQFTGGTGIWAKPALRSDGSMIVGGDFTAANGTPANGVALLGPNGVLDTSFNMTAYTRVSAIRAMLIQADGKILLGGGFRFGTASNAPRAPLVRITAQGGPDPTYTTVTSIAGPGVRDMVAQPDGKVVATAGRADFVGFTIFRFQPDGGLDSSFRQPSFRDGQFRYTDVVLQAPPSTIALLPDGKFLIGGAFTDVDIDPDSQPTFAHCGAVRLDASGAVDPSFALSQPTGLSLSATSFVRDASGVTFAAAKFEHHFSLAPPVSFDLARLLPDGSVASGPSLSSTATGSVLTRGFSAKEVTPMVDGKLLISGSILLPDGYGERHTIARFLPDGSEDPGFRITEPGILSPHSYVGKAFAFPDGGALIAADGADPQTTLISPLYRLRASGGTAANFQLAPEIANAIVIRSGAGQLLAMNVGSRVLAVQPDGKIIFIYLSDDHLFHLVRLNSDGSIDGSFASTTFTPSDLTQTFPQVTDYQNPIGIYTLQPPNGAWTATVPVSDAQLLPDGKIIMAGRFTSFAGYAARGLVRLHSTGAVDTSFTIGSGAQWTHTSETASLLPSVEQVEAQVDGRLLIAGTFETFNGTLFPGIASLHADGTIDPSFTPPVQRQKLRKGPVNLQRQPDGSFLLGGPYRFPNETEPAGLVRIETIGGVPVVGSPTVATAVVGRAFSYQIVASGQPTSFGASGFLPAGFNFDSATGVISGTATNANIGSYDVLLTATNGEGTSAARVLKLTVPGLPQITAAASRKWHSASAFDVDLPLSGKPAVECRSPDATNAHLLVVTFSNEIIAGEGMVTSGSAALTSYLEDGKLFIELTNVSNASTVSLTVRNVTDRFLQAAPEGAVSVSFLLGDSTGDGSVNSGDALQTRNRSGQQFGATNFRSDLNVDGTINSGDATIARSRSGQSVP